MLCGKAGMGTGQRHGRSGGQAGDRVLLKLEGFLNPRRRASRAARGQGADSCSSWFTSVSATTGRRTRPEANRWAMLGGSADRSRHKSRGAGVAVQGLQLLLASIPGSCSGNYDFHPSRSQGILHSGSVKRCTPCLCATINFPFYGYRRKSQTFFIPVPISSTNSRSPNSFRVFLRPPAAPVLARLRGFASRASPPPSPRFSVSLASLFSGDSTTKCNTSE